MRLFKNVLIIIGLVVVNFSCCKMNNIETFYYKNKSISDSLFHNCQELNSSSGSYFIFRKTGTIHREIYTKIKKKNTNTYQTIYFSMKGEYLYLDEIKKSEYYIITESQEFKQVLSKFITSKYKTIDTESWGEGIFFGKCSGIRMKKGELGIKYFTNPDGIIDTEYRKKIEGNVYVEHSIVP